MSSLFQTYSQFYKPADTEQKSNQIVNISDWSITGDFDPYAEGTRSKYVVRCPNQVEYPFLIPGHRYLYKKTFERKSRLGNTPIIFHEQFWIEIIAYRLGRALGVEVPPAVVGCRTVPGSNQKEYAALIEWYYDYPGSPHASVDRGGGFMSSLIPDYDRNKGRQHNFRSIETVFRELQVRDWQSKWASMLLFDALIGNTDRHQENWEVVSHFGKEGGLEEYISPAFDNGTAMGYEVLTPKIPHKMNGLEKYIEKGTHHMRWELNDADQMGHFDLIEKIISTYPQVKPVIVEILSRDLNSICNDIRGFTECDIENHDYRLSSERAEFIIALFMARHTKAKEVVGL